MVSTASNARAALVREGVATDLPVKGLPETDLPAKGLRVTDPLAIEVQGTGGPSPHLRPRTGIEEGADKI